VTVRSAQGLGYGQRQNIFLFYKKPKAFWGTQTLLFNQCRGIFPGGNEAMGQTVIQTVLLVWDLMSVCCIFPLTYFSLEKGHNEKIYDSLFIIYCFYGNKSSFVFIYSCMVSLPTQSSFWKTSRYVPTREL